MNRSVAVVLVLVNSLIHIDSTPIQNNASDKIFEERLQYASKMASYMNTSVDPCDDFYEYACGNYFNVNKPKLGIRIQSALLNIENQEIEDFREILMQPINGNGDPRDNAKVAYQACMKANVFDYKKSEAYLNIIKSIGGWPALDPDWKPENFDWFKVMTTLKQYGVSFMIEEEIKTDRDEFFVEIKPEIFGLFEFLKENLNHTSSKPYRRNKHLAIKLMEMYKIPKRDALKAFGEILEFGQRVAMSEDSKLILSFAPFVNANLLTISNVTEQASKINWVKYFNTISGASVNTSGESIFVATLPLLKDIPDIFEDENIIRGAANYAVLKLLYALHQELKSAQYPERFCFFHVQKYVSSAASALYSQSKAHFKEGEDEAWNVLSYVRDAFKDRINDIDWLDADSKKRTIAKVDNMKIYIGYSNYSVSLDDLKDEYSGLELDQDDYYENNLKLRLHYERKLHKPLVTNVVDREQYIFPLLIDLNAFYSFSNKLIIPAVLLIKPYAYPELPKSFNFGSIGRTIGHEMIHGFDSMGRVYNEFAEPQKWWSDSSVNAYEEREECLENQYSKFRIPELNIKINGEDTIQENIADNGGIRQIFYGYQKWLNDNKNTVDMNSETLPGLNLTNNQLFFLAFGQMFCTRYNSEKAYKLYTEGTYAVEKYRLIGTLSNFKEFSQHFGCSVGSKMNPEKKCILW